MSEANKGFFVTGSYNGKKEQTHKTKILHVCPFYVSDVFAAAKTMLFAAIIIMLLAKARI